MENWLIFYIILQLITINAGESGQSGAIQDVNNNPLIFDDSQLVGSVLEHSRAGASVLTVTATDADNGHNGRVTYSIRQVPAKHGIPLFALNPDTGLITTTMNNVFDREETPEFRIIVKATDRGTPRTRSATATVTVHIQDINDNSPLFTKKVYQTTMSENNAVGSSVISVSATDADIGSNAKLTYSLKEEDREYFYMSNVEGTNTGVLKLFKSVDYETIEIPFFNLTVYVRDPDASHVDRAFIEVEINNYNDIPPEFYPSSRSTSIEEDVEVGSVLATFSALDKDEVWLNDRYSIDKKTDSRGQFSVDANGMVSIARPLDRETTPVHRVHILAADKGEPPLTGTATLIVTLKDVNDNSPKFDNSQLVGSVLEHSGAGVSVLTVNATDLDNGHNGTVTYSIRQVPVKYGTPLFVINPDSGVISTTMNNVLDREETDEFRIIIKATDQGTPKVRSATATVTVHIKDINDNSPRFSKEVYQTTMSENYPVGSSVISVSALDPDIGINAKLTYTLKEEDSEYFYMSYNGVLKLLKPVDLGTLANPSFNLTVYVSDPDSSHSDTAFIEVWIDDNENPPVFAPNNINITIEEDIEVGSVLATFSANDNDKGLNKEFDYAIDPTTDPVRQFSIDSKRGIVRVARLLDTETTPVHRVGILAVDRGEPALTGTATLIVTLSDVNDNSPKFDSSQLVGNVFEHSSAGVSVLTVNATDIDSDHNGRVTYSIKQVPVKFGTPLFMLNRYTGLITTTMSNVLDREEMDEFKLVVKATDQGAPKARSATATFTIHIQDINDNSPHFTKKVYRTAISENHPVGSSVTSVSASDPDIGINAKLTYTLEEDREYFSMSNVEATNTGELKLSKPIDLDTLAKPFFNLTVYVSDPDASHVDRAFIEVWINNYNDSPPGFTPDKRRMIDIDEILKRGL